MNFRRGVIVATIFACLASAVWFFWPTSGGDCADAATGQRIAAPLLPSSSPSAKQKEKKITVTTGNGSVPRNSPSATPTQAKKKAPRIKIDLDHDEPQYPIPGDDYEVQDGPITDENGNTIVPGRDFNDTDPNVVPVNCG